MKKGISLIVLVITIIVIIILAGAVILSLSKNNPIIQATKATFLNDISSFQSELLLYQTRKYAENKGSYSVNLLQADESNLSDDGTVIVGGKISQVISGLSTGVYNGQFKIIDGTLVYSGTDINKKSWAIESGTKLSLLPGNLFASLTPWTVGGTNTNVTFTEPGPVIGSSTWKFTKSGTTSQWNGWEGNYGAIFTGTVGDKWVISGCYKTNDGAVASNLYVGNFYTTDWSRPYNTTIINSDTKIIADGQWHYFYCTIQINENITNAVIVDGPSWGYSTVAGTMYMNGIEWIKIPYGT
jgi:hypothetical protein